MAPVDSERGRGVRPMPPAEPTRLPLTAVQGLAWERPAGVGQTCNTTTFRNVPVVTRGSAAMERPRSRA